MKKAILISSVILISILLFSGIVFFLLFPMRYKDIIEEYSAKYNLKSELVFSVVNVESSFDKNALSSAGAMGLMQVLPSTATEVAQKIGLEKFTPSDLYEPEVNLNIGCYYLRYLLDMFNGDEVKALCAYNAGYNNVISWLSTNGTLEEIPFKETQNYVNKIYKNVTIYKYIY